MFQIRSEITGIREYETFEEAMKWAKEDKTVWKVSFSLVTGERVRLVRAGIGDAWILEQMSDAIKEALQKR